MTYDLPGYDETSVFFRVICVFRGLFSEEDRKCLRGSSMASVC